MADLDAELLALAGDDSSGEESVAPSPKPKSPSPSRTTKPSRGSPAPDMTRKAPAKPAKRSQRRKDYSDDEDEGSVASHRSESVSMSQSDSSEGGYSPDAGKPIFPYEKLYYDAADKARIDAKNEIEREEILAQRSEQLERHEQDLTLRRLVAARAREEAKTAAKNKRKASAADLDDSQRKSSRQRTKVGGGRVGEASSAIEAYKKQRAEKNLRDEQRKQDGAARRPVSRDSFSDADAEGESDNDYDDRRYKKRSPTPPRDDPTAELRDINHIRVGRENFAQVCYTPGFEQAMTDCYARVCIGPGKVPGVNDYRLCLIKGFKKGTPYAMTAPNGRPFPVDMYIIAAHGKAEKPWSFLECSMQAFTDEEWRRYRAVMANDDCKMPTKGLVNSKVEQINKLIHHRFSEAEISSKMKRQNDLYDEIYKTEEKNEIKQKLRAAIAANDHDLADELEEQLANIVPKKLAFGTTLERKDSGYVDKNAERLAELNRRNMRLNAENIRKAQLAEMKARKMKKHLAPGVDELFEGGSDISRSGTPVNGTGTPKLAASISRTGTPKPVTLANGTPRSTTPNPSVVVKPVEKKKGLPVIRKAATDDEILANMDLGIDIDI